MPEQCRVPAIGAALILAAYMASPTRPSLRLPRLKPGRRPVLPNSGCCETRILMCWPAFDGRFQERAAGTRKAHYVRGYVQRRRGCRRAEHSVLDPRLQVIHDVGTLH
jgi:hypothetical protein